MGECDHGAEEESVFEGASGADQVGSNDGFAVAWGHGVHGSKAESEGEGEEHCGDAEVLFAEELGEGVATLESAGWWRGILSLGQNNARLGIPNGLGIEKRNCKQGEECGAGVHYNGEDASRVRDVCVKF